MFVEPKSVCCCCCLVAQLYPTLCDPLDSNPPGSSAHGISQARILEWVTISFSRGSSQPIDWMQVSCVSCIGILYHWATWEALKNVHNLVESKWPWGEVEKQIFAEAEILQWEPASESPGGLVKMDCWSLPMSSCHYDWAGSENLHFCHIPGDILLLQEPHFQNYCEWKSQPHGLYGHGILQARILEWTAFPFSRGSSQPRDWIQVSLIAGRFFTSWATREAQEHWSG